MINTKKIEKIRKIACAAYPHTTPTPSHDVIMAAYNDLEGMVRNTYSIHGCIHTQYGSGWDVLDMAGTDQMDHAIELACRRVAG